jgi:hypothetical protein
MSLRAAQVRFYVTWDRSPSVPDSAASSGLALPSSRFR